MLITTYLQPEYPIDLEHYTLLLRVGGFSGHKRLTHSTLYALSVSQIIPLRPDGEPQHIRKDGRDERIIALRNGEAIRKYIQRNQNRQKMELFIPREMDIV